MKNVFFYLFLGYMMSFHSSYSQIPDDVFIDSVAITQYLNDGTAYYRQGVECYSEAIVHFEKAIKITDKIGVSDSVASGKAYQILGYLYEVHQQDIPKAVRIYEASVELLEPIDIEMVGSTYFNLANHYLNEGRFEKALVYYDKSLQIYLRRPSKSDSDNAYIAWHYLRIGDVYRTKFGAKKDFVRMDTALCFYDKSLQYIPDDGTISELKARLYLDKGNGELADYYIRRAEKLMGKENIFLIKARIQAFNQKYTEALEIYKKALKQENQEQREQAKIHISIGDIYLQWNQIDKALLHYQKTLHLLIPSFAEENPTSNPNVSVLEEKDAWIMQALINKGNAFRKRGEPKDLKHALACYHLVFDAVELLMQNSEDKSEQIVRGYVHTVVENMLEIYAAKKDENSLVKAFEAMETNKAITLLKQNQNTNAVNIRSLQQIQYEILSNPQNNKALLQFFLGDSTLYTFLITPTSTQLKPIPFTSQLQKQILDLQKSIHQKDTLTADLQFDQYTRNAQSLYQKLLLKPFGSEAFQNIQHLYVVPDGLLYRIPFEALLTEAPTSAQSQNLSYQNLAYLLQSHDISYAYSATLLLESLQNYSQTSPTYKGNLLGFAPSFGKSYQLLSSQMPEEEIMRDCKGDNLSALPFSELEVGIISKIIGGQVFVETDANKTAFLEEAQHYRILHLSTHACMDKEDHESSRIYFADQPLLSKELYPLQLQADLAVLSACETGTGPIQQGEGVMSLARAFMYAGCPSVVTSLWGVSDEKTSELMSDFYTNLKGGQSKSTALRNAKLSFLQHQNNEEAHPFYWAAFIQIGNPKLIELQSNLWKTWVGGFSVLGFVALIIFSFLRRK